VSYRPDAASGALAPEIYPTYPPYVWSSVGLNASLSDLETWAGALVRGDLVPRQTLLDHWQALPLSNGRPGAYADGWEYSDLGEFITVGHGGGNRVNFMHGFRKSDPSDNITVIYLDNGGPREIPTRRITTVLANEIIPGFATPTQVLFETLVTDVAVHGWPAARDRLDAHIADQRLSPAEAEALLNGVGYTLSSTFGPEAALDPFRLNVARHPQSANPHDSLGETLLALGDAGGALEHYRHALAINPEDGRVAAIVGRLQQQLNDSDADGAGNRN
jgi:tetratricopeptide (TPR) repeat protein